MDESYCFTNIKHEIRKLISEPCSEILRLLSTANNVTASSLIKTSDILTYGVINAVSYLTYWFPV